MEYHHALPYREHVITDKCTNSTALSRFCKFSDLHEFDFRKRPEFLRWEYLYFTTSPDFLIIKDDGLLFMGLFMLNLRSSGDFNGFEISHVLNKRVGVALSDGAHVGSSFHHEVSIWAPGGTPRVLDIPEINALISSVSSCQDGMVNILSTFSTVGNWVNTSSIVLETSNNLEWNGNGTSVVESFCQFLLISLSNVIASVSAIAGNNFFSMNARVSFSNIRISCV